MAVEVAYATPERQLLIPISLAANSTVELAIEASGILREFPEIDLSQQKVGIFGVVCNLDKNLSAEDRVEIYRPLKQNPMDARRGRLQK
ncbi:RnfH family protein [Methylomonas sp. EFPC1]|uniref:RnfH family protein n=1 Tax=unclassified Methylomonas TaxID=2608980 RepID=UPI00191DE2BC|nr:MULTISPECIES: RnfH family protein [unclassified Methylomonas]QSB03635.1 RnfH family protein [Methylomonas sp. EFPC1]